MNSKKNFVLKKGVERKGQDFICYMSYKYPSDVVFEKLNDAKIESVNSSSNFTEDDLEIQNQILADDPIDDDDSFFFT